MDHGSNGRTPPAEQSSQMPPTSSGKRPHGHHYQRARKKQKILSSETETQFRPNTQIDSSSCFTSFTCRRTISCTIDHRRKGNYRKSHKTHGHRKWTYSIHGASNYGDKVVIVSYNILGVENVAKHPELYKGVSPKYLDWEYRKKLLYKELNSYRPSILCFQEVDRFDDLNELFEKDGFEGVHKARAGEAWDGCAIFWKTKEFTLLHEESIDFQRFGLRNNVAQFCILKMNQTLSADVATQFSGADKASRRLLIGNIHVLYNPKRGDIKLGQMRVFLEKAYQLSQEWGSIPVVITGDLNSLPQSAMYEFLASAELNIQQHDRKRISGQMRPSDYTGFHFRRNHVLRPFMHRWTDEEVMLATGSRCSCVRHPLKLSSAYAEIPGSSKNRDKVGEPLVTSYHCTSTGTVDYIWHTLGLAPIKVLETLPIRSLKKTGGLPSKKWGSDHLALACEFAFTDDGDELGLKRIQHI